MSAEVKTMGRTIAQPADGELPPFTLTVVMNMAGERQIHLASPVTEPIAPEEANRRVDGLMKLAERQRSLIEIRVLEEELGAKTDALAKVWQVRKAEAEAKHADDLKGVQKSIAGDMAKQEKIQQAAYAEARQTGRTGEVKLQGARLRDHTTLQRAIDQHRDSVARKEAEFKQNVMAPIIGNIEKLEADIREINRQLERHRKIVG